MTSESLLSFKRVRERLPVSRMTLHRWITQKKFPQPVKINTRNYWVASEVDQWVDLQALNRGREQ